jgi:hypothetical protein
MLTLQDVIFKGRLLVNETQDKPGWLEQSSWQQHCWDACDELGRLDATWITQTADIVSGQAAYTYPDFRRITSIVITQSTGNIITVEPIEPWIMDERVPYWRNQPNQGDIIYAIMASPQSITFYPTPNYNWAAADNDGQPGFQIEGFGVPSAGGVNSANLWPLPTSVCPLPVRCHPYVIYGAAKNRCIQFAGDHPSYDAKFPKIMAEWERMKGELELEIELANDATRFGDAPDVSNNWLMSTGIGW